MNIGVINNRLMKLFYFLVVLISTSLFFSCEKSNNYYSNFNSSEIKHNGTTYDFLVNQKGVYDSLILVLERLPRIKSLLSNPDSSCTFFAINNRSFALAISNLNSQRKKFGFSAVGLEDIKSDILDTLIDRYVFNEKLHVDYFVPYLDGKEVLSKKYHYKMHIKYDVLSSSGLVGGGQQELVFSDVNGSIYERYWNSTNTVVVDFNTLNGVIHTLVPRHEFGFGKLTSRYTIF